MGTPLNVLLVDDSQNDADLVVAELKRAGFDPTWTRVEKEPDYLAEIRKSPDIVLSDFTMPQFSGPQAARLLCESGLNIPFILFSGTAGVDAAVEAMKQGAADYLPKERLSRLGNTVHRALEQQRLKLQRRQAEDMMRQSETRFREMVENVDMIAMTLDKNGIVTFCNDHLARLTGWKREEVMGGDWFARFIPKTDTVFKKLFLETIEVGKIPPHHESLIKTKDGELREVVWNNITLRNAVGNFVGMASIGEDVTERKRGEAALRDSEERFRELAENIEEVFWITDRSKEQMLYVSPAYERIWGRTCESLYLQPQMWREAIQPQDRERVLKAALAQQTTGVYDEEYCITQPDGSRRWVHDRSFPVRGHAGEIKRFVGVAEDITRRKDLEEQFHQSQRLESVGRLAGGMAHDFNNMLAVVLCNTQTLLAEERLHPEDANLLKDVVKAALAASQLTRQLLGYSSKQTMQVHVFDPNEVVSNLVKMLRRVIGKQIELKWESASPSLRMEGDPGMLEQVVVNLAINARDAMSKGGELLIKTESVILSEAAAKNHPGERPGEFILLTVRDTGCGIPREDLPHIFEPFFTTKEAGKGTGLGLATVFGIVQQHRGWVEVESKVNCGTSFKVYLPSSSRLPESADLRGSLPMIMGGTESVLLVEDERTLRSAARLILQRLGYTVFEAASSMEALAVWKEQNGRIDLLLTDIVMPDAMTGRELVGQLRLQKPQLRVIFTSGYDLDRSSADFLSREDGCFLSKPYDPRRLAEIVRQCLDKASSKVSSQEGNKPGKAPAHARKKLLIVDDNPALRLSMARGLRSLGFEIIDCDNGIDGFQLAREHVPELIISDVNMERGDGFSLLAQLRQDPLLAHIPVIFLTGQGDSSGMRSGMEHGADDYLSKPFEIEVLRAAVKARLARRRSGDASRDLLVKTLQATTDLVCIARLPDYLALHLNRAGRKLTGLRTTEHLDSFQLEDIYSRKGWATLRETAIPQAIACGMWSGEIPFVNRSGDEIPASQVLLVHADGAGIPEYLSIVARDLSERIHFERRLAESQARVQDLTGRLDSAQEEDRCRIARQRKLNPRRALRDESL